MKTINEVTDLRDAIYIEKYKMLPLALRVIALKNLDALANHWNESINTTVNQESKSEKNDSGK